MLRQQTSLKRWFAYVNMTSDCYVTNNVCPVLITTMRHCSTLEFGRGASNEAVTPGITRPLHVTDCRPRYICGCFFGERNITTGKEKLQLQDEHYAKLTIPFKFNVSNRASKNVGNL